MSRATWLAFVCALSAHALASPLTDPTAGRAVFTGAATSNPTSLDLNPAALGLGKRTFTFYTAAIGVLDTYSIDLTTQSAVDATTASPGDTLALIWHSGIEGRVTLGVELMHVTPGERFIENEAFRYQTLGGYHRVVAPLTLGGSLRISNSVFVGASFAAQTTFLKLRYARDTALEAGRDPSRGIDSDCGGQPCGIGNDLAAERYEITASSGYFSGDILVANLGAVVQLKKDVWLGVGYHAPPGLSLQSTLTGSMQIERAARDGGGLIEGGATVYISQPASVDAELRARLREDLDLHVGARWQHLSRFQTYDVRGYGSKLPPAGIPEWEPRPRGFHQEFAGWVGVEQIERESPFVFGGRIGIERSALNDERTSPLTVAPTSLTLDGGAQWRFADSWVLQTTYGIQLFKPLDLKNSAFDPQARLTCMDSGFDYSTDACAAVRDGYAIPSAAGSYTRIEHAMRLAVRYEY